ncbi:MAG: DUF1552 domain-containing protein [Rubritalea sp.]|jgi:hypothetical protein|tara:strand:- start:1820 stop:3112 length:1293 start_codon:yes stop_codon:yes gene_type:complete
MKNKFNRRHFLRGTGALIALPALESIGFRQFASAAENSAAPPPKRAVFLGFGFGVTQESWYPDITQTGAKYDLSKGLAPLVRHQKDITVVQGCSNQYNNEAHWGSTFWLTGANRYAVAGQSMANSISADQVAAQYLGQDTRFTSLQLGSKDAGGSGHGPGLSLAWDQRGKPMAGQNTPLELYHKLFSASNLPLAQRQAAIAERRSVLDAVLTQAKQVQRGLSKNDIDKLDEYFQGIRDIETQLGKEEAWLEIPKAKPPIHEPASGLKGKEEIKMMYDLIAAALQTDSTRVMSYRQPVQSLLQSLDITVAPHNMSHYTPGERMEASQKRDIAQSELLAGLLDKLKATKEADGSSLLDHVALAYGSNIRSIHYLDNCPTILAGGGANLTMGQHLALSKDTPLCDVWLTMLNGLGVQTERHGDSSGVVKKLQV